MPSSTINLEGLVLDEFGRVALSDELLDGIQDWEGLLSAGGLNGACGGSINNNSCSNALCRNSTNSECNNQSDCSGTFNGNCQSPNEVPE